MPTPERAIIESMFMIPNKDGEDVPFILNETQRILDEELCGRDLVPKARQEGISSYVLALFTTRCLYKRNTRAVVISHDAESTERLFKRVAYFLGNIRGPKPVTGLASKREYTFPKTDSMFYIGTAGARKFGRGDTITDLHGSEVGFWEDAKSLTAGLFQAVPRSGTIILESTGNGRNWYYRRIKNAIDKKGRFKIHFFNWIDFKEYDLYVDAEEIKDILTSLDPELEEPYLVDEVGLSPGQIKFRREKLDELDYDLDLFKQEYPITLDECFRATGKSIFHKVLYSQSKDWQLREINLYVLNQHPREKGRYAIGADVGGGIGQDNSVAEIIDLDTMHQVAEWTSNKYSPDAFADVLANLGRAFNEAYITVEANNHGVVTLDNLRRVYPIHKIHKKDISGAGSSNILSFGLLQTSRTRPHSLGTLRKLLSHVLVIHSPLLKDELETFVEKENGKLEAEEGTKDDRVMAMAAFAYTCERASLLSAPTPIIASKKVDPFSLEAIIEELRRGGHAFPVSAQTGELF